MARALRISEARKRKWPDLRVESAIIIKVRSLLRFSLLGLGCWRPGGQKIKWPKCADEGEDKSAVIPLPIFKQNILKK
jgi:hypothetical protein